MYTVYKVMGGVRLKQERSQLRMETVVVNKSLSICLYSVVNLIADKNVSIYIHRDDIIITTIHHFPEL